MSTADTSPTKFRLDRLKNFGGPVLSLASQGTGVVQLALLVWRNGANTSTDAYFYLWNLALLPTLTLLVGVMYPMLLNEHKISKHGITVLLWLTPALSMAFTAIGAAWLYFNDRLEPSLFPIVAATMLNGVLQSFIWFRAVLSEAEGDPRWMAGIALPANILAVATLVIPWSTPQLAVTAMLGALAVGNLGLLIAMTTLRVGKNALNNSPAKSRGSASAFSWFLGRSGVGQIALILIQSTAVLLPASSLTILSVATKIVGSASATLVNAVIPRIIHQTTNSPSSGRHFLKLLWLILFPLVAATVAATALWFLQYFVPVLLISIWLLCATTTAVAQRMTFRFLPPNASRLTILSVSAVAVLTVASSRLDAFDLNVLLAAYAAIEAAGGLLLLLALRVQGVALLMMFAAAYLGGFWVGALLR